MRHTDERLEERLRRPCDPLQPVGDYFVDLARALIELSRRRRREREVRERRAVQRCGR